MLGFSTGKLEKTGLEQPDVETPFLLSEVLAFDHEHDENNHRDDDGKEEVVKNVI